MDQKRERVRSYLKGLSGAAVGLSGGVDSTLLAKLVHDALGAKALALTACSPSLAAWERDEAQESARAIGIRHRFIGTDELENPAYAVNDSRRCFFCKEELVRKMWEVARIEGLGAVLLGNIADDIGDWRPGIEAAKRLGAASPLLLCGVVKAEVRAWARDLGLANWDKPQAACLASRVAHGEPVTAGKLSQIEQAESFVRGRTGAKQLRVRLHGTAARIEVEEPDFDRLLACRGEIVEALRGLGFTHVSLDLAGYRPGSADAVV